MNITNGTKVTHPIYGDGHACGDPVTVDSHQWSGTAVWCCFYRPQTAIAANWPYMVPVSDLTVTGG
jgi:hypothetical protein